MPGEFRAGCIGGPTHGGTAVEFQRVLWSVEHCKPPIAQIFQMNGIVHELSVNTVLEQLFTAISWRFRINVSIICRAI